MIASLVLAAVLSSSDAAASTQTGLRTLGADFDPLRRQFNDEVSKVRVLALLSPT